MTTIPKISPAHFLILYLYNKNLTKTQGFYTNEKQSKYHDNNHQEEIESGQSLLLVIKKVNPSHPKSSSRCVALPYVTALKVKHAL